MQDLTSVQNVLKKHALVEADRTSHQGKLKEIEKSTDEVETDFLFPFFCDQIVSMAFGSQLISSAKQVTLMPTPLWPRHPTSTSGSMDSWSLSKGESIVLWSHWPFNSSSVMLRMKRLGFEKKNPLWLQIIEVETSLEFRYAIFDRGVGM